MADKGLAILEGKAGIVAGVIRRKATYHRLDNKSRKNVDDCARYLKNKVPTSTTRRRSPKAGPLPSE